MVPSLVLAIATILVRHRTENPSCLSILTGIIRDRTPLCQVVFRSTSIGSKHPSSQPSLLRLLSQMPHTGQQRGPKTAPEFCILNPKPYFPGSRNSRPNRVNVMNR